MSSVSDKYLTFLLLNTRPYNKHANSSINKRLNKADILFLADIHITQGRNTQTSEMFQFQCLNNRSADKFQSINFVYRDNANIVSYHETPGRSYITMKKNILCGRIQSIADILQEW